MEINEEKRKDNEEVKMSNLEASCTCIGRVRDPLYTNKTLLLMWNLILWI